MQKNDDTEHAPEQYAKLMELAVELAKQGGSLALVLREKNNAIVHLAISDSNDNFSVDADDMGDIVKLYQQIIEKSFKKIVSQKNLDKKIYSIPPNYKLRAFAFSRSSFNIHLYSAVTCPLRLQRQLFGLS